MQPNRFQRCLKSIDQNLERAVICCLTLLTTTLLSINLIELCGVACYRKLVIILARTFKKKTLAKPLSVQSAMIANMDTMYKSSTFSIIAPTILEGVPDIETIRQTIKIKVLEKIDPKTGKWFYPELLQNIVYWMGYPFWRKLDSDKITPAWFLQECVHFYKNDDQMQCDFHQLENIVRELCFQPYAKDKPMVEVIIIPKFTPHQWKQWNLCDSDKKYFVFILRIHHALTDGYPILRLFKTLSITASSDVFDYLKLNDYTQKSKLNSGWFPVQVAKYVFHFFKMIYEITEYLYQSNIFSSEGSLWDWDKPASPKLWNDVPVAELAVKRSQNYITSWGRPFDLSEINDIKKIHGVSGTTVIYAAILGSLRKNMFSNAKTIPPYMSFAMPLPLPRKSDKLRNFSALMTVLVPLGESDPVKRLHKMQGRLESMKKSTLPVAATVLTSGVMGLVPRCLATFIDATSKVKEAIVVSNIAGPKEYYDLMGYPVRDSFWATGQNIDRNYLFINLFSGGGQAKLAVMGHSGLLTSDKKAQDFIDSFFDELEILKISDRIDCSTL